MTACGGSQWSRVGQVVEPVHRWNGRRGNDDLFSNEGRIWSKKFSNSGVDGSGMGDEQKWVLEL